jgi:radical SAM protein with 4Fe4S-binding SPASM domain
MNLTPLKRFADFCLQSRPVGWAFEQVWNVKNRRSVPIVNRVPDRPPELTIEVTNICNANCTFCGYQYQERAKGIMSLELFQRTVDNYAALGGGMIELTPIVGDALVDKRLEEKVRYARSLPQIGRISFITNAILLNKERFEALAAAGVTNIGISISGLNKEEYEKVYRVARYDTVIRNLTEIARSAAFSKVSFIIGIRSARPWSWRYDPDLHRLRALGYTSIGATVLFDNWSGRMKSADLPGGMFVRPLRSKRTPCRQLYNSTTVMADGSMTACGCRDLNGRTELSLGKIQDQTLEAPWRDGRMEKLRQRFRDGDLPDVCRDCRHYTPVREELVS